MDDTDERNRRIVEAHRAGGTLRAIAAEHDISYERVRQIVAKADGSTKPRATRKAKTGGGAGTERVRLRIGNLAKAVLVTGQAYQDPKDALNEFISNAADEYAQTERRGERIRVVLRRKAKHPVIAIDDRGRGMSPDRLREVARNLFESTKAGDDRTLGEKAIGLLGFQQLGGRIEIVSRTEDSPDTWVLTLQRGHADASLGRERRRARSEAGTTVYLSQVDPEVLRMLTQRKVIDYLRRRRGAALARGDYEIEVTEGRATELVTPEEPDGVRLAIPSRPTLWGRIEFNLYVAPDIDPRRRVAIVGRAGTTILDDIAELEELDHLPWTSGQISGQIAFEALQQSAGRRAVIRDDDAFPVFREAITSIEAVVSKTLEKLRHEIDEATADRMSDIVRKLFGRVLKELADLENPMRTPAGTEPGDGALPLDDLGTDHPFDPHANQDPDPDALPSDNTPSDGEPADRAEPTPSIDDLAPDPITDPTGSDTTTVRPQPNRSRHLGPAPCPTRKLAPKEWWEEKIGWDLLGNTYSRRGLVLEVVDCDGGAHVDLDVGKSYFDLTRANGMGWFLHAKGRPESERIPFVDPVPWMLRQIGHEILSAFDPYQSLLGLERFSPPIPDPETTPLQVHPLPGWEPMSLYAEARVQLTSDGTEIRRGEPGHVSNW